MMTRVGSRRTDEDVLMGEDLRGLAEAIKREARALGFDAVGISRVEATVPPAASGSHRSCTGASSTGWRAATTAPWLGWPAIRSVAPIRAWSCPAAGP